jgi:hypothetical protein
MYHSEESDHAITSDTATYAAYADAPAAESDWDFGNSGEFGSLAALG